MYILVCMGPSSVYKRLCMGVKAGVQILLARESQTVDGELENTLVKL